MKIIAAVIGIIGLVILVALLLALPVMWLWNDLMPHLFGFKELTLWEAFELSLLSGCLFSSKSSSSKND